MLARQPIKYIPSLVQRAANLAEQMNYSDSISPEAGRLLQLLSSQFLSGVLGEIGTGCGVAAAWIVSALTPGASFFTVEANVTHAAAARALFESYPNVRVVHIVFASYKIGVDSASDGFVDEETLLELYQSLHLGI